MKRWKLEKNKVKIYLKKYVNERIKLNQSEFSRETEAIGDIQMIDKQIDIDDVDIDID